MTADTSGELDRISDPGGGDDEDSSDQGPRSVAPESVTPGAVGRAWAIAAVVTIASFAALSYAFLPGNAGQPVVIGTVGATYLALTLATVIWLRRRGELMAKLFPRRLDATIGALVALVMYLLAVVFHTFVTSSGAQMGWMMRIYMQIGDSRVTGTFGVGLIVLAVAAAEEIVWRGLVMGALAHAYRARKAWLITTALYAAAHLSTIYLLRDPAAGPNPLLFAAAAFCGLIWGYMATVVDRVALSVFAHAVFTWAIVEFPLWRM